MKSSTTTGLPLSRWLVFLLLLYFTNCQVVTICKAREYDFLDYRNEKFNVDFLDFNRKVTTTFFLFGQVNLLRDVLRKKLEATYQDIWDTPHAFQYLARFALALYLELF